MGQDVYYAELSYNEYESDFLGVFSTSEKAQEACRTDYEYYQEDDAVSFEWQPKGDSIWTDDDRGYTYRVLVMKLDEPIRQYNRG